MADYLFTPTDADQATVTLQSLRDPRFDSSKLTPLIDAVAYFSEVDQALSTVESGDGFVYLANWGMDSNEIFLDPLTQTQNLWSLLIEKAKAGADVRVSGWVGALLQQFKALQGQIGQLLGADMLGVDATKGVEELNRQTIGVIAQLRRVPELAPNCILNTIAPGVASVHLKLLIIGTGDNAVAFTGGIDFKRSRISREGHPAPGEDWHDVMTKVEGPGVQGVLDVYRAIYNEQLRYTPLKFKLTVSGKTHTVPSHVPAANPIPKRKLSSSGVGTHTVQNVVTLPDYRTYSTHSLSFLKSGGLYYTKDALAKAIDSASTYIYYEDQYFWSGEIMQMIRKALERDSNLVVILVTSGSLDPDDVKFPQRQFWTAAFNDVLLHDVTLSSDPDNILGRVRLFRLWGETRTESGTTGNVMRSGERSVVEFKLLSNRVPPRLKEDHFSKGLTWLRRRPGQRLFRVVGNRAFERKHDPKDPKEETIKIIVHDAAQVAPAEFVSFELVIAHGVTVHAKTILIDDKWGYIGSANCAQRSLYTDIEHGVGFIDSNDNLVQNYRTSLWDEHFQPPPPMTLRNLDIGLHSWENEWSQLAGSPVPKPGRVGADPAPPYIEPVDLPISPPEPMTDAGRAKYEWLDPDIRNL